jgi:transcriptional regulator with PAS, ATPase and Fis domain
MSLTTQVKILRVLEERKISPVGSTEQHPIDVRIIAATNKNI